MNGLCTNPVVADVLVGNDDDGVPLASIDYQGVDAQRLVQVSVGLNDGHRVVMDAELKGRVT